MRSNQMTEEITSIKKVDDLKKLCFDANHETIIIYGTGNISNRLITLIESFGEKGKIANVMVSSESKNIRNWKGYSVNCYDKEKISKDNIVLVATTKYREEIVSKLLSDGVDRIVVISDEFGHCVEQDKVIDEIRTIKFAEKCRGLIKPGHNVKNEKDILFVTPPYWDAYSPFCAVPCLMAAVLAEGLTADQLDIGIYAIRQAIKRSGSSVSDQILNRVYFEEKVRKYVKNDYIDYETFENDMWFLKESFDIEKIKQNYFKMNDVQKSMVDAFYNLVYYQNLNDIDFDNCDSIATVVNNSNKDVLFETLNHPDIIQRLCNLPDIIGVSITSTCQFISGCLIAKIIKQIKPMVKIIFGGSCADVFARSSYAHKEDILEYFDYIIVGEGETAVINLIKHIQDKLPRDKVPNLVYFDAGKLIMPSVFLENVNNLFVPNFDGLNLTLYLAPEAILPYQSSRGCHYGQCAFCNHDSKYRHNYRSKNMKRVVNDLLVLSKKYSVRRFQFVDEAIRPDCFAGMIDEMDKYNEFKQIKWFFYSRVSREYNMDILKKAHKNGCEMVMFGVETFNQRLLSFIKKGISAEVSEECLKLFQVCGIKTYAWLMYNLPSESIEEAEQDLSKVKSVINYMGAFSVGPFALYRNTDMFNEQRKYNILDVDRNDKLRFVSHNNGEIIDNETMLDYFGEKYAQYQQERFLNMNRYTLFFL